MRDAQLPVSAICQAALERAVRDVSSARGTDRPPPEQGGTAAGLYSRFTPRARSALALAQRSARDTGQRHVGTEHLLLGVLDEGANVGLTVLTSLDVEPADVRVELVASMAPPSNAPPGDTPFAPLAKRALEASVREALGCGHNYVGCEHLLLGLLATEDGIASQVLRRMGLELRTTRRAVTTAVAGVAHGKEATRPPAGRPGGDLDEVLRRLDAVEVALDRLTRPTS